VIPRKLTQGYYAPGVNRRARVALSQLSLANPKYIDAGIAAVVQQTNESTAEIKNSGLMRNYFPSRDLHQFRYLI
jgi:hypothetical protein